jgi:hypothetical protein
VKATGGLVPDSVENAAPSPAAQSAQPNLAPAPAPRGPRRRRHSDLKLGFRDRCLFYMMVATMHLVSLLPDFVLYVLGVGGAFDLQAR